MGARVAGASFQGAKLDGTDFRSVWLGSGRGGSEEVHDFVGTSVRNADFTGAMAEPSFWSVWSPSDLEGVSCPDGRAADAVEGCAGRFGTVEEAMNVALRWLSTPEGYGCPAVGQVDVAKATPGGRLKLLFRRHVRLANGEFVQREGKIVPGDDVWTVVYGECGTMTAEVIDRVNDPDGSAP